MLVSSPLDMSSFGTRSMFQSFARPYFFHGSDEADDGLYFLNSCNGNQISMGIGQHSTDRVLRTYSKLTEAASLSSLQHDFPSLIATLSNHLRAVVVIAVDVEHFLALDTEDTVALLTCKAVLPQIAYNNI